MNRRSFLTGAASTAAIAATGGIGAAAGGVAAPVVLPTSLVAVEVSETMYEVWMALPGQPMRLMGVGPEGISEEMIRRAQAGFTREMLVAMDTMDMRRSASLMQGQHGCPTLREAKRTLPDLSLKLPYKLNSEPLLIADGERLDKGLDDYIALLPEADQQEVAEKVLSII